MSKVGIALVAFATCLAAADAQMTPTQFDLVCSYSGRLIADPGRRDTGNYSARSRVSSGTSRYMVDLDSMLYCKPSWCATRGPAVVASATSNEIVLVDHRVAEPWIRVSVRRADGHYENRISASEGFLRLYTGSCTVEPFSGFPPLENPDAPVTPASEHPERDGG